MRRKKYLSIIVALFLLVATVAPVVADSSRLVFGDEAVVVSTYNADGVEQPKKKGNAFVRAISAPFRALGRLFGGGKKKSGDAAKKKAEPRRTEVADANAAPGGGSKEVERVAPPPVVENSVAPMNVSGAGATVIRPADGQPAEAPKPPRWVPIIGGIGRDPLSQGRALLQHGYVNEAVSELVVAASIGPDLVEANALLGLAYNRLGNHAAAIEAYERALSLAPDNAQVINNLGYALSLDGRHSEALKKLKRAARLAPGDPYILNNMAHVQARLGKFSDAYKSFARVLGEYQARLKTAELLEQAGRIKDAIKHYEAAYKIEPNSPALLERLAELYDRTGRQREAQDARQRLGKPKNKQKTATGGGG